MNKRKVIIIGAAGRDFHNFNIFYRDQEEYQVVAFTAAQIPDIDDRKYPAELAGKLYPEGIPIRAEEELPELIAEFNVDDCVFSYSDVTYQKVMGLSAIVQAAGANFLLLGPKATMLKSTKSVIAVCATRTGCGKSQTSRKIIQILKAKGLKVVAVRHPMPYGNLNSQRVQRFAAVDDLIKHHCTIEEMEEYEPHLMNGVVVYAGVDYEAILREAEKDPNGCDLILWDGGNNDFTFYKPDLLVTVVDPHRSGNELTYYPGEVNLRMADVVIVNKTDTAPPAGIQTVHKNIQKVNPTAQVINGTSPIRVDNPAVIKNKRVLVIEDGPTLTHGEMKIGAGTIAASQYGAIECIDPREHVVGKLAATFRTYPNIGKVLPAMGYGAQQIRDLEATIENTHCDAVIIGTPIDLKRIVKINKPSTRVYYELQEVGSPNLEEILTNFIQKRHLIP